MIAWELVSEGFHGASTSSSSEVSTYLRLFGGDTVGSVAMGKGVPTSSSEETIRRTRRRSCLRWMRLIEANLGTKTPRSLFLGPLILLLGVWNLSLRVLPTLIRVVKRVSDGNTRE